MELEKIGMGHRALVESYTRRHKPYSDFNFTSMYSWNTEGHTLIGESGGNLVVRFTDYVTGAPFYSFIGEGDANATARLLLERSKEEGLAERLELVPEDVALALDRAMFNVEESRDHFDYVFDVSELCRFEGSKFQFHRSGSNKFVRQYCTEGILRATVKLGSVREAEEAVHAVNARWATNKAQKADSSAEAGESYELAAIRRFFEAAERSEIFAHCLFYGSDPIGYALFETLPDGHAITHFSKADIRFVGVYSHLTKTGAESMTRAGIRFLNCEQDLGISGLRNSKGSFNPVHFLKKYTVERRK